MGLLGKIVTAPFVGPFKGALWVVKTLAEHAEQELYNEDNIRKDLLGLEQQYDSAGSRLKISKVPRATCWSG